MESLPASSTPELYCAPVILKSSAAIVTVHPSSAPLKSEIEMLQELVTVVTCSEDVCMIVPKSRSQKGSRARDHHVNEISV